MTQENLFLLHALEMGVFISFLYDLLRIFRRLVRHNWFWVSLEDVIFWIYCAISVFLLLHRENNGILRWFAVLGAMAGIWAYLSMASPQVLKYAVRTGNFLKKQLTRFFKMLTMGFKGVMRNAKARQKKAGGL